MDNPSPMSANLSFSDIVLWLYGIAISILSAIVGFFLKNLHKKIEDQGERQYADSERIAVLETMAEGTEKSLESLHEKVDKLIDAQLKR